ncbi:hypothetical protein BDW02DRAFT_391108 [Decorospora gaudefroyi]|uniref:Rrn9 domain-containing protein n=1 Tax=Decorospora gaudefroyi TaxID=184978 RepID=A0A6A5KR15_9PLEO|nr:hypothetical protein BDW02DRAFT_391108 [Decorospora gaudefroyi]
MSLFGGSAPPSDSSYESDSPSQPSARASPSVVEMAAPQKAQQVEVPIALDADDDVDTDSETASDASDEGGEEEPTRPNRFLGQAQTWQRYTEADRQIAESLDQAQEEDLSAQLYNTHALKRRLRRPVEDIAPFRSWDSRDNWLKAGQELEYTDAFGEVQTELVPPKDWTAWPLPPDEPSGSRDRLRNRMNGYTGEWSIGGPSTPDAGEELREELLAVFLRLAKERWNAREADSPATDAEDGATPSRNRSRSKNAAYARSSRSTSRADVRIEDEDTEEEEHEEEDEEEGEHTSEEERGRTSPLHAFAIPTILADDARAQRLLQPSIHSMMSKLDHVALAILRTRVNHFGRGGSADSSQSEFTSGAESSGPASRSSSRARSKSATSREPSRPASRARSVQVGRTAKEGKEAMEGEAKLSSSESSDSDTSEHASRPRKRRRSSSDLSDSGASTRDGLLRDGLLDWSEVLGLAAVQGWDKGAIARTAQRCATLFGESMSFQPFHEALASKPATEPVQYTPSLVPAPNTLSISEPPAAKRPYFQAGTLRCPHTDCFGHEKDFALPYRVVEHCVRVHGYDPRTNDSDNEERTVGGVHIDGFLQPVTAKPGWIGNGRGKFGKESKKARKKQRNSEHGYALEDAISSDL